VQANCASNSVYLVDIFSMPSEVVSGFTLRLRIKLTFSLRGTSTFFMTLLSSLVLLQSNEDPFPITTYPPIVLVSL